MTPGSHLSAISELQNAEAKSTQTLTRTNYLEPSSSSTAHSESDEQEHPGQSITATTAQRSVSDAALNTRLYLSDTDTDSPTDTVTAVRLPATVSSVTFPRIPTQPSSTSPEPSPSIVTSGRRGAWSLMGRTRRRGEKAEEKRRKKEEARAYKGQLAVDLRGREEAQQRADGVSVHSGRNNERIVASRAWEEDIAVYGGLASM
jgi:hypothetical protein